jgi:hypothetical protein
MSRHSAKTAGRSVKTVSARDKKAPKNERAKAKKSAGSTRRPSRKGVRAAPPPKTKKRASPSVAPAAAPEVIHTASPPVQPAAPTAPPVPLRAHKYSVGETVYYTSPSFGRAAANGNYTVVKLLPSEGDDYQYRIKSTGEAFERVAKESQLDKA